MVKGGNKVNWQAADYLLKDKQPEPFNKPNINFSVRNLTFEKSE
jgi:hypothetical protein